MFSANVLETVEHRAQKKELTYLCIRSKNILTKLHKMILQDFRCEFERLFKSNIDEFIETFILCELPEKDMKELGAPFILTESALQHKEVLIQTVKILTLMKISKDNNEFTKLQKKLKACESQTL